MHIVPFSFDSPRARRRPPRRRRPCLRQERSFRRRERLRQQKHALDEAVLTAIRAVLDSGGATSPLHRRGPGRGPVRPQANENIARRRGVVAHAVLPFL